MARRITDYATRDDLRYRCVVGRQVSASENRRTPKTASKRDKSPVKPHKSKRIKARLEHAKTVDALRRAQGDAEETTLRSNPNVVVVAPLYKWDDKSPDAKAFTVRRRNAIADLVNAGIWDTADIQVMLALPAEDGGLGVFVPEPTIYQDRKATKDAWIGRSKEMNRFGMEAVLAKYEMADRRIALAQIKNPLDPQLFYMRLALTDRIVALYGLSAKDRLAAGKVDGPLSAGDVDVLLAKADAMDAVTVEVQVRRDPAKSLFHPSEPRPGRTHALGLPLRAAIHKDTDGDQDSDLAHSTDDEPPV